MRRRPNQLLHRLLITSLIIIAAMHPDAVSQLARLGTGLVLAILNGIAQGAAANPGPALLAAGAVWIAHNAYTSRPRPRARTAHAHH